jgi:acetolactate synthase I/II/III large subunit
MHKPNMITTGELIARCLEAQGVKTAYGVISIHNMPILDAFNSRKKIRFISARGEAGACNMADACARATQTLGVCITSTGTGAGNAAGALIEAMTAGTPMLHITGQIDSPYIDKNLGFIHEAPAQLAMLKAVGKDAFRISAPQDAMAIIQKAIDLALTAPCGPVSIEIPIDVQSAMLQAPLRIEARRVKPIAPNISAVRFLTTQLQSKKRPLLWLGGGARHAQAPVERLIKMGFGVVTSVQGRGIVDEQHPASLGAFNLQKPVEAFYKTCDAMLVVGSKLRSNETLSYKLALPSPLYRVDADSAADQRAYPNETFVKGDALLTLNALADALEGKMSIDPQFASDLLAARVASEATVDDGLGAYVTLKNALNQHIKLKLDGNCFWVRDITLSNTMWGNRSLYLNHPRSGIHALGGGIGQGLAMGIGAAIGSLEHGLGKKTIALMGDGGFMLNPGELACAAQEKAELMFIVMNDGGYGVIKNIQDAVYGSRHCYVDLHTPNFMRLCESMAVPHFLLAKPQDSSAIFEQALQIKGPVMVEVDMKAWGPFVAKFAGPPKR